jgi:hypothetical protein
MAGCIPTKAHLVPIQSVLKIRDSLIFSNHQGSRKKQADDCPGLTQRLHKIWIKKFNLIATHSLSTSWLSSIT